MSAPSFAGSPRCTFTLTKKVVIPAAILFRSILMAAARISASGAPTNVAFPPSPIHLVTAFNNVVGYPVMDISCWVDVRLLLWINSMLIVVVCRDVCGFLKEGTSRKLAAALGLDLLCRRVPTNNVWHQDSKRKRQGPGTWLVVLQKEARKSQGWAPSTAALAGIWHFCAQFSCNPYIEVIDWW